MISSKDVEKVARSAGVDNLSREAAAQLQKSLEEIASAVAAEAAKEARAAGRKLISGQDVLKASGKA